MGPHETELRNIAAAGEWRVEELRELLGQIQVLLETLRGLGVEPGWEGDSATAATGRFGELGRILDDVVQSGSYLFRSIGAANSVRSAAVAQLQSLPGTFIPDWVYDKIDEAGDAFPFMGWYFDAQKSSLGFIESFLGDKREQSANEILVSYRDRLVEPARGATHAGSTLPNVPDVGEPLPDPAPEIPPVTFGPPAGSRGPVPVIPGFETPTGFPPPPPPLPPTGGPYPPPPTDGPGPSVDDPGPGYIPSPPGTGLGGPGTIGGPGGSGLTGVGAGVGAAALAAGVGAKALGLGAGGIGAAGAAGRPGAGGLLGGGGAGAGGAGAGRSAAGRSGGRGLLGGAQGGGGAPGAGGRDEKKRAAGRGLGGAIAPHLDDDETYVPRGAGTRAGGRDDVDDADPFEPATD